MTVIMCWVLFMLLFVMSLSRLYPKIDDPIVRIPCGQLRGKIVSTGKGNCYAYFGVPFAAPPIGGRRWKKPEPPTCWSGIRECTDFAPRCIQVGSSGNDTKEDSEDCLYLNVFVPETASNTSTPFPVMVYIHGGAFAYGSAQEHSQDGTCENLSARGVIVVVIQYRLLLYGFFSTEDTVAPGNYAIWDQIEALKWVQENIEYFGGDPNRVTIFGESAGGASVSYLTYIREAKDLFQQSISQSGSTLCPWALPAETAGAWKRLARAANCSIDDSNSTVNCLRNLSTVDLQKVYNSIFDPTKNFQFVTRIDGELFTGDTFTDTEPGKPAIIGVTSGELSVPDTSCLPTADTVFNQTLESTFQGDMETKEILEQIARYVYVDTKGDPDDAILLCQQAGKLQASYQFHCPAAAEATSKLSAGTPVWIYNFDYYAKNVFPPDYPFEKLSPHAHDLCYLFLYLLPSKPPMINHCPTKYDGEYRKVADYIGEIWTNFAIKGDPSPRDLPWPRYNRVRNGHVLRIRSTLSIEPSFYTEDAIFFNVLKPNIENILSPS